MPQRETPISSRKLAAAAGGTAAGCAAVACCCPCGFVGLLLFTAGKIPAELVRRRLKKRNKVQKPAKSVVSSLITAEAEAEEEAAIERAGKSPATELSEMDEKMWSQFSDAGFWRSSSQREIEGVAT